MSIPKLNVQSQLGCYTVRFSEDLLFLKALAALPNVVLIVDGNVARFYAKELACTFGDLPIYLLHAEECKKNLREVQNIYTWIISNFSAKKNLTLVSIGGGITQDITGFVASTLFRGIAWHFVPTTLLAQVDSCIGAKTSLNFGRSKNLIGTFYPPRCIYVSSAFLSTLNALDMASGYGEILKFLLMRQLEEGKGLMTHKRLLGLKDSKGKLTRLVRECLVIKRSFIEGDEFDQGRRNLLNYGHCFGHALESASTYYVPHGVAVNVGMVFANIAAAQRGFFPLESVLAFSRTINLPVLHQVQRPRDYRAETLLCNAKNDKKRTGNDLALVMPSANGLRKVTDFTEHEFRNALAILADLLFDKKGKHTTS